jgi:DNA-directed RNA polymerase-3 subunit RPC5
MRSSVAVALTNCPADRAKQEEAVMVDDEQQQHTGIETDAAMPDTQVIRDKGKGKAVAEQTDTTALDARVSSEKGKGKAGAEQTDTATLDAHVPSDKGKGKAVAEQTDTLALNAHIPSDKGKGKAIPEQTDAALDARVPSDKGKGKAVVGDAKVSVGAGTHHKAVADINQEKQHAVVESDDEEPVAAATGSGFYTGDYDSDDLRPERDDGSYGLTTEEESSEYDNDEDPNDPVIAEYDIYLHGSSTFDLYELRFSGHHKEKAPPMTGEHCPTEIRIKPKSGMFEVDVPINVHQNYDRQKGVRYGEALKQVRALGQTSYGASAGFQRAMPRPTKRPGASSAAEGPSTEENEAENEEAAKAKALAEQEKLDSFVENFDDANEKGHVLNTQTWSGQLVGREEWKPNYYVGAFRGNEVHMTPLTGIVRLEPENKHLDAIDHLDIVSRHREATDAKDVLPTVNKAPDEMTTADRFQEAAQEPFNKYRWIDRTSLAALARRKEVLYLKDVEKAVTHEWESTESYVDRLLPTGAGMGRKGRHKKKEPSLVC